MAKFSIIDPNNKTNPYYVDLGTSSQHTGTSWVVSKDPYHTQVIDSVTNSAVYLTEWITPLPKRKEDKEGDADEFYSDLKTLYVKVRIHCGNAVSRWVDLPVVDQTKQDVVVTEKGNITHYTNTDELKWR